jgi:hypothetical protein
VIAAATECFRRPEPDDPHVAMLVATRTDGRLVNACFDELGEFVRPGDLLVVNTSATLAAALPARLDGKPVELHLSTPVDGRDWVVELRTTERMPLRAPAIGARVEPTPGGFRLTLDSPAYGVARGQAAVLYEDGVVVGAGTVA